MEKRFNTSFSRNSKNVHTKQHQNLYFLLFLYTCEHFSLNHLAVVLVVTKNNLMLFSSSVLWFRFLLKTRFTIFRIMFFAAWPIHMNQLTILLYYTYVLWCFVSLTQKISTSNAYRYSITICIMYTYIVLCFLYIYHSFVHNTIKTHGNFNHIHFQNELLFILELGAHVENAFTWD